jgi:hypothetical protein
MSDNQKPPPPPEPEVLPGDRDPPLLQDPPVRWPPEPPHEDQVECDGSGHEFPPEAIEIAEWASHDG